MYFALGGRFIYANKLVWMDGSSWLHFICGSKKYCWYNSYSFIRHKHVAASDNKHFLRAFSCLLKKQDKEKTLEANQNWACKYSIRVILFCAEKVGQTHENEAALQKRQNG